MNRWKAVSVLVALGSIAIVTVLALPTAAAAPTAQTADARASSLMPTTGFTCTLSVTTTDTQPGNQSFETAFLLTSVDGLALVPFTAVPPGTVVEAPAQDDYFFMNSIANGTIYHVAVTPANMMNYNLGLDVYDGSFNLIASDANPVDNYSAEITFAPTYNGKVYFRVYQLTPLCSGGNYSLRLDWQPPMPTPSFGYGMVMAGPDNAWPDWIGFNFRLVLTLPVMTGKTELMRLAVDASDLNDLTALGNRIRQIVAANSSVESFQIGNDPNLASEWGAPPDAADYREVLCAAYQSIKQTRPWAVVVSGGLATTGRVAGTCNGHPGHNGSQQDEREFLKEFIAAGGGNCLNAVGYNALGFGTNYDAEPDVDGGTPATNCLDGRCFRSVEKAYAIMQSYNLVKPVFLTGVGWLTVPPSSCLSDPRWQGHTGEIVTTAQQSDNLVGAFRYGRFHWPWLKAMFVFNLDFNMAPWYDECDPLRYYSVAGQPAFLALGRMSKELYQLYMPVIER